MLYNVIYWAIFIASIVLFVIDFARAKPDIDRGANRLFNFGMVCVAACAVAITWKVSSFCVKYNHFDVKSMAVLIATAVILLFVRKVVDVFVIQTMGYLFSTNNSFAQKYKPKVVIKNPDPTAEKPEEYSLGVLGMIHAIIYGIHIFIVAICAAFPGITNSRVSFCMAKWSSMPSKMVGTGLERAGFMIFVALFILFWVLFCKYCFTWYKNFLYIFDDSDEKDGKIKRIKGLRIFLIILFVVRKVFDYILFDFSDKSLIWKDLLFWVVLAGFAMLAMFLWWLFHQKYSKPLWNIW